MDQREMFTKSSAAKSRGRWTNSILEKAIVKVIRDGLNACRIPNYEIKARTPCARCHLFTVAASEPGIPDLVGWIPANLMPMWPAHVRAVSLFVEVKRPKRGIESEAQKQFLERANRDGAIAIFARGWDECAGQLRAAGVKLPKGL